MSFTNIPDPAVVLGWMEPVTPHIYTALEYGTMKAREYADQEGEPIDREFAPDFVRHHAKRFLQSIAESGLFKLEQIPQNGLHLTGFGELEIRIFKAASDGLLPVPNSKTKEEFFEQLTLAVFQRGPRLKVVVLWDVDRQYNLRSLTLACPKTSDPKRFLVEAHWYAPIPYVVPRTTTDLSPNAPDVGLSLKRKKKPDTGSK